LFGSEQIDATKTGNLPVMPGVRSPAPHARHPDPGRRAARIDGGSVLDEAGDPAHSGATAA